MYSRKRFVENSKSNSYDIRRDGERVTDEYKRRSLLSGQERSMSMKRRSIDYGSGL